MAMWPAALFSFLLGIMATLHLARTPGDRTVGVSVSTGLALAVWLISPLFLVPFGLVVVVLGWKRDNATLGKRKKKTLLTLPFAAPSESDDAASLVLASWQEGKHAALLPYQRPVSDTQRHAHAFIARVHRTNPFRPEGASGLVPTMPPPTLPGDSRDA